MGGQNGQNFFADCGRCVWIWTWVLNNFFLVYGAPNPWWGSPGPNSRYPQSPPPPPPLWALAGEDRLFSGT